MTRQSKCGALLLAALLAGAAGCPSGNPPGGGTGTSTGTPAPDFTVKAVDLCKEYHADPAAADAKYKGKWLLVEGPVGANGVKPGGFGIGLAVEVGEYRPDPEKAGRSARADMARDWEAKARAL